MGDSVDDETDEATIQVLMVECFRSSGLPFSFADQKKFQALLRYLRPNAQFSSSKDLRQLNSEYEETFKKLDNVSYPEDVSNMRSKLIAEFARSLSSDQESEDGSADKPPETPLPVLGENVLDILTPMPGPRPMLTATPNHFNVDGRGSAGVMGSFGMTPQSGDFNLLGPEPLRPDSVIPIAEAHNWQNNLVPRMFGFPSRPPSYEPFNQGNHQQTTNGFNPTAPSVPGQPGGNVFNQGTPNFSNQAPPNGLPNQGPPCGFNQGPSNISNQDQRQQGFEGFTQAVPGGHNQTSCNSFNQTDSNGFHNHGPSCGNNHAGCNQGPSNGFNQTDPNNFNRQNSSCGHNHSGCTGCNQAPPSSSNHIPPHGHNQSGCNCSNHNAPRNPNHQQPCSHNQSGCNNHSQAASSCCNQGNPHGHNQAGPNGFSNQAPQCGFNQQGPNNFNQAPSCSHNHAGCNSSNQGTSGGCNQAPPNNYNQTEPNGFNTHAPSHSFNQPPPFNHNHANYGSSNQLASSGCNQAFNPAPSNNFNQTGPNGFNNQALPGVANQTGPVPNNYNQGHSYNQAHSGTTQAAPAGYNQTQTNSFNQGTSNGFNNQAPPQNFHQAESNSFNQAPTYNDTQVNSSNLATSGESIQAHANSQAPPNTYHQAPPTNFDYSNAFHNPVPPPVLSHPPPVVSNQSVPNSSSQTTSFNHTHEGYNSNPATSGGSSHAQANAQGPSTNSFHQAPSTFDHPNVFHNPVLPPVPNQPPPIINNQSVINNSSQATPLNHTHSSNQAAPVDFHQTTANNFDQASSYNFDYQDPNGFHNQTTQNGFNQPFNQPASIGFHPAASHSHEVNLAPNGFNQMLPNGFLQSGPGQFDHQPDPSQFNQTAPNDFDQGARTVGTKADQTAADGTKESSNGIPVFEDKQGYTRFPCVVCQKQKHWSEARKVLTPHAQIMIYLCLENKVYSRVMAHELIRLKSFNVCIEHLPRLYNLALLAFNINDSDKDITWENNKIDKAVETLKMLKPDKRQGVRVVSRFCDHLKTFFDEYCRRTHKEVEGIRETRRHGIHGPPKKTRRMTVKEIVAQHFQKDGLPM